MTKEWYGANLFKENAEKLKEYLRGYGIYFEPSENGTMIHFEILLSPDELTATNKWIGENL